MAWGASPARMGLPLLGTQVACSVPLMDWLPSRSMRSDREGGSPLALAGTRFRSASCKVLEVSPCRTRTGMEMPKMGRMEMVNSCLPSSVSAGSTAWAGGTARNSICDRYSPAGRSSGLRDWMRTTWETPGASFTSRGLNRTRSSAVTCPGSLGHSVTSPDSSIRVWVKETR